MTDLVANEGRFTAFLLFFDDERLRTSFSTLTPFSGSSTAFFRFSPPSYLETFWQSVEEVHATLPHSLLPLKVDELFAVLTAGETGQLLSDQIVSWMTTPPSNLRRFMEDHYDKALTVEDYAYLTGRSESTFRRDFKARFGTTPRQWIIRKRLEKAYQLLEGTDWDVTQVAEAVGYDSVSHFISAFKKQYRRTPGQKPTLQSSFDRKAAS